MCSVPVPSSLKLPITHAYADRERETLLLPQVSNHRVRERGALLPQVSDQAEKEIERARRSSREWSYRGQYRGPMTPFTQPLLPDTFALLFLGMYITLSKHSTRRRSRSI